MRTTLIYLSIAAISSIFHSVALAQHVDVRPYVSDGRIVTGATDDANPLDPQPKEVRAFGYDFGEDASQPYFVQDPGFNAPAGSGLIAGSQLGFNVTTSLLYWSGDADTPSFGVTPAGETLALALGANSRILTSTSTPMIGFSLQTVPASGAVHQHLGSFLLGSDGNAVAGDGIEPTMGVYAFALVLTSTDPDITSSLPFYIVFNNGLDEARHEVAIQYLASTLIPEPIAMSVGGALALALCRVQTRRDQGRVVARRRWFI